jgi:hypothetical protein
VPGTGIETHRRGYWAGNVTVPGGMLPAPESPQGNSGETTSCVNEVNVWRSKNWELRKLFLGREILE